MSTAGIANLRSDEIMVFLHLTLRQRVRLHPIYGQALVADATARTLLRRRASRARQRATITPVEALIALLPCRSLAPFHRRSGLRTSRRGPVFSTCWRR